MTDLSSLSREQLLNLLQKKEEDKTEDAVPKEESLCQFKPTRVNQKKCVEKAHTEWGFCKRHSRTVQAKKAKEEWERVQKTLEDTKKEEPKVVEEPQVLDKSPEKPVEKDNEKPSDKSVEKPKTKKKIRKKIIKPNCYGRYEDKDSHIVFHPGTKSAYGVQMPNGDVGKLTPNHIAICKKHGWPYTDIESSSEEESEEEYEEYSSSEEEESDETSSE